MQADLNYPHEVSPRFRQAFENTPAEEIKDWLLRNLGLILVPKKFPSGKEISEELRLALFKNIARKSLHLLFGSPSFYKLIETQIPK